MLPFDVGFDLGVNLYLIFAAILVFAVILAAVKTVPQGMHFTVERFGRYTRTLQPGLNILTPFVERVGDKINMREQVLAVPSQEVITRDNAAVTVDGVTFFQVLDAARAAYEVTDLENAILNLTMTNIRSVMGSLDLDELLSNRDEINSRVLRVVDAAVDPWGVRITRIEIKDINPPQDLAAAMAQQMKAEREKRAVVLEAEGERLAAIARAEGEKTSLILAAEGRREAAFRDAEARERLAEADARATSSMSEAIQGGSLQAINYFVAEKYVDALAQLASAPNQRTLILPLDATATLGSLAGIAEIARETFASVAPEPASPAPQRAPAPDAAPLSVVPNVTGAVAAPAPSAAPQATAGAPAPAAPAAAAPQPMTREQRTSMIAEATEALAQRLGGREGRET